MDYNSGLENPLAFEAAYTWDSEGRMTGTNYGPNYTFQYDVNGRLGGMQEVVNGYGSPVASATYGFTPAGQLRPRTVLGLGYLAWRMWVRKAAP